MFSSTSFSPKRIFNQKEKNDSISVEYYSSVSNKQRNI